MYKFNVKFGITCFRRIFITYNLNEIYNSIIIFKRQTKYSLCVYIIQIKNILFLK